ncbi:hypothetical protein [Oceanispirochaeta sp.]|jgi:hypothetical protein|uniref:hypothetical protein n=1 Tax=Oceanispirochaeta sp. TaxID=2035350 RepID=UPI002628B62D|nr:hypothetical protein [Oceanispirochaeta sp.]MDA3956065.1 hypothetical protein [Oceanispirochaeta sp.]
MKETNPELQKKLKDSLGIDAAAWSLGRLFSFPGKLSSPAWGLFAMDASGDLHFIRFHQQNWYSSLTQSGASGGNSDTGDIQVHICFPSDKALSFKKIKKRGFFSFLTRPFPLYHLEQEGSEGLVIFELEDPDLNFLTLLDQFFS